MAFYPSNYYSQNRLYINIFMFLRYISTSTESVISTFWTKVLNKSFHLIGI